MQQLIHNNNHSATKSHFIKRDYSLNTKHTNTNSNIICSNTNKKKPIATCALHKHKTNLHSSRNNIQTYLNLCNNHSHQLTGEITSHSSIHNNNESTTQNMDFFRKCKSVLPPEAYNQIIEIVHLFNNKQINKEETYCKITDILSKDNNNSNLKEEFNLLFI